MANPESGIVRVVLAEDHHVVRSALLAYLRSKSWIEVVADLNEGSRLLETVARAKPDILIMDAEMPNHRPIEFVRELQERLPDVRVLILSAHSSPAYVVGLFQAGIAGYVLKNDPPDSLLEAIRQISQGLEWISPQAASVLAGYIRTHEATASMANLTEREREVLALMARGYQNDAIAKELVVSRHTVRNHVASIFHKLGVDSRVKAVLYALCFDIVPLKQPRHESNEAPIH